MKNIEKVVGEVKGINVFFVFFLAVFLISSSGFTYGLDLISPDDDFVSFDSFILFGWNAGPSGFYNLQVSSDENFDDLFIDKNLSLTYYSQSNIPIGKWFWRVLNEDNGTISISDVRSFSVIEKPERLVVSSDLSDYSDDQFVRIEVNAPIGSEVFLKVDGPGNPIIYHPLNVTNSVFFVKLVEPGVYEAYANMSYFGFNDEATSSFTVPNLVVVPESFWINFSVVDINNSLDDVLVRYVDNEGNKKSHSFDGFYFFKILEGDYDFKFSKEGYVNRSFSLDVDENISKEVVLELSYVDDEDGAEGDEVEELWVKIVDAPSEVSEFPLEISYESNALCSLHIGSRSYKGDGSMFLVKSLLAGNYSFEAVCKSDDGREVRSEAREISVAKPIFQKVDVVSLSKIDDILKIFEKEGVFKEYILDIKNTRDKLSKINNEFYNFIDSASTQNQINLKLQELKSKAGEIIYPNNVEMVNLNEAIFYLPLPDSKDIFEDYLDLMQNDDKDFLIENYLELQEPFILKVETKEYKISFNSGKTEDYTVVKKRIEAFGDDAPSDFEFLEYVPFKGVEIYSEAEKLGDFFVSKKDEIVYGFNRKVGAEELKKCISFSLVDISSDAPLITGLASSNVFFGGGNFGSFLPFMVLILVVSLLGGLFIPGSPIEVGGRKSLYSLLNDAIDRSEKEGVENAIPIYLKILNRFEKASPEEQEKYRPFILDISHQINLYSLKKNIKALEKEIIFQNSLAHFDHSLYTKSRAGYIQCLNEYESLREDLKVSVYHSIIAIQNELEQISNNKYK